MPSGSVSSVWDWQVEVHKATLIFRSNLSAFLSAPVNFLGIFLYETSVPTAIAGEEVDTEEAEELAEKSSYRI